MLDLSCLAACANRVVQTSSATKDGPAAFASGSRFYSPAVTVIHSDQQQCTYAAASPQDAKKSHGGRVLGAWSRLVEDTLEAPIYSQLKVRFRVQIAKLI